MCDIKKIFILIMVPFLFLSCWRSYYFKFDTISQNQIKKRKSLNSPVVDSCIIDNKSFYLSFSPKYRGFESTLFVIDKSGEEIGEYILGDFFPSKIVPSLDGKIFVAGKSFSKKRGYTVSFIAKYTLEGVLVWEKKIKFGDIEDSLAKHVNYYEGIVSLSAGEDGAIFAASQIYEGKNSVGSFNYYFEDYILAKFDDKGNLLWKKKQKSEYAHDQVNAVMVKDDILYVVGTTEGNLYKEHSKSSCPSTMLSRELIIKRADVPCKEIFIVSFSTKNGVKLHKTQFDQYAYNEIRDIAIGNGKIALAGQNKGIATVHFFNINDFKYIDTLFFPSQNPFSEARSIVFHDNCFHVAVVSNNCSNDYWGSRIKRITAGKYTAFVNYDLEPNGRNQYTEHRNIDMYPLYPWNLSCDINNFSVYKILSEESSSKEASYECKSADFKSPKIIIDNGKIFLSGSIIY